MMKLVLGKGFEYPLMLKNEGRTAICVGIIDKMMFSSRSQEMKILKEGLRDIAAKIDALEKATCPDCRREMKKQTTRKQ